MIIEKCCRAILRLATVVCHRCQRVKCICA